MLFILGDKEYNKYFNLRDAFMSVVNLLRFCRQLIRMGLILHWLCCMCGMGVYPPKTLEQDLPPAAGPSIPSHPCCHSPVLSLPPHQLEVGTL